MRLLKSARTQFVTKLTGANLNHRSYEKKTWETDAILFQNQQWAVTTYGLENIAGPYHYPIPKSDLEITMGAQGRTWCDHMAEKNWVDVDAFEEAFDVAMETHRGEVAA